MREAGDPTTDEPSAASLPKFRIIPGNRVALTQAGIGLTSGTKRLNLLTVAGAAPESSRESRVDSV